MTDPITTPEQMREAAIDAVHEADSLELATHGGNKIVDRIRAIPCAPQPVAVTVKPLVWEHRSGQGYAAVCPVTASVMFAEKFDATKEIDQRRSQHILSAIEATPARNVRAAALREAEKSLRDWQDDLNANSLPETAITVGGAADLILALIDKEASTDG